MSQETLSKALGLRPGQVVAAVGGGGKTSLLNALARECVAAGWHPVIMTTTTHMFAPEDPEGTLLLGDVDSLNFQLEEKGAAWTEIITLARTRAALAPVPGNPAIKRVKLKGFNKEEIAPLRRTEGILLVEADGSRGLPIKAPGPNEPVIPLETNVVLGVVGLDALGTPIDEGHVFRPERLSQITGLAPGDNLDAEAIARLAAHPEGLFRHAPERSRRIIILNKSDRIGAMEKLEQIGYIICEAACVPKGPAEALFFTSLKELGHPVVFQASS